MTTCNRGKYESLFEIHPETGADIVIFYADRALETFGGASAGWYW